MVCIIFNYKLPRNEPLITFVWTLRLHSLPWVYGDSSVKGGRGVDLAEILHIIFFLLALPRFSPLFCPNLGGQLACFADVGNTSTHGRFHFLLGRFDSLGGRVDFRVGRFDPDTLTVGHFD